MGREVEQNWEKEGEVNCNQNTLYEKNKIPFSIEEKKH